MSEIHDYLTDHRFSEIISNLNVKCCISTGPYTLTKDHLMADAKELLREKRISGIPIVDEDGVLNGLVTIEDIIVAIEQGYLNEPIFKHMTTEAVTLNINDDMNSVLEKFLTYTYGRFPVVDDDNRVVGVITKGDLALCIL